MNPNEISNLVYSQLEKINKKSLHEPGTYTVLSSILINNDNSCLEETWKVVSIGTGTTCLNHKELFENKLFPQSKDKICLFNYRLHDSHAEVIARRGFIKFIIHEIENSIMNKGFNSSIIESVKDLTLKASPIPQFKLKSGDGSMEALRQSIDGNDHPKRMKLDDFSHDDVHRGRTQFSKLGKVRTKPGRGDAINTLSMSCSDKIALWNCIGIQGALLANFLIEPIFFDFIIVGEWFHETSLTRALITRVQNFVLHHHGHLPTILHCTSTPEGFYKPQDVKDSQKKTSKPSFSWIQNIGTSISVEGWKQGSIGHRGSSIDSVIKSRSILSRFSLFESFIKCVHLSAQKKDPLSDEMILEFKFSAIDYQSKKKKLLAEGGSLHGWVVSRAWRQIS